MNRITLDTQSECVFCLKPQQHVAYCIIPQTDWKFLAIVPLLLLWSKIVSQVSLMIFLIADFPIRNEKLKD